MSRPERFGDEPADPIALRRAERTGFIVVTPNTPQGAADTWRERCERRRHPVVIVDRCPGGRAEITLDVTSWPHAVTSVHENAIDAAFRAAGGVWNGFGQPFGSSVRGVMARALAGQLLQILGAAPDGVAP